MQYVAGTSGGRHAVDSVACDDVDFIKYVAYLDDVCIYIANWYFKYLGYNADPSGRAV
jgi:hypothetical protein